MSNPLDQPVIDTPVASSPAPSFSGPSKDNEGRPQQLAIESSPSEYKEEEEEKVHILDLGEGNVVKLDKLGPMIINSDGTLSRIQNWQDLHPIEQERTVRLLVKKRNLVRLKSLSEQDEANGLESEEKLSASKEAEKKQ